MSEEGLYEDGELAERERWLRAIDKRIDYWMERPATHIERIAELRDLRQLMTEETA